MRATTIVLLLFLAMLRMAHATPSREIIDKSHEAVVVVVSYYRDPLNDSSWQSEGRGTIVEADGEVRILTNYHVVDHIQDHGILEYMNVIFSDGGIFRAKFDRADRDNDLALIVVDRPGWNIALPVGEAKTGEVAFAFDKKPRTSFWKTDIEPNILEGSVEELEWLWISPIQNIPCRKFGITSVEGMSGGPVLNQHGQVIGLIALRERDTSDPLDEMGVPGGTWFVPLTGFYPLPPASPWSLP